MRVTLISDTHAKHRQLLTQDRTRKSFELLDLIGGDLLLHSGDFMTSGWSKREAIEFFEWMSERTEYKHVVFIAGNHDRIAEIDPDWMQETLLSFPTITYLQDNTVEVPYEDGTVKIYGSPWQPWFHNWAFNLPRAGSEIKEKWDAIPEDADIVLTHGPAQTYLDTSGAPYNTPLLGCELLKERIELIRPKIHVCGHIHGGHGHHYNGHTHFFNASILNERYEYSNAPFNFDWDPKTNEITWLHE